MIGEANKERQTTFYYINAAADEKDGKQYTSKYHHASSQTTECRLFTALNHPPLQLPSGAVMKQHSIFTTWGCLTTYFTCKPPILMGRWRSSIGEPGHSGRFLHYHRANFLMASFKIAEDPLLQGLLPEDDATFENPLQLAQTEGYRFSGLDSLDWMWIV